MNKTFSDGELLRLGWRHAIDKLGFFVLLFFASLAALAVPFLIFSFTMEDYPIIAWIVYVGIVILGMIMGVGVIKISLNIVDGQEPKIKDLFMHWNRVLTFLGTTILCMFISYVGFVLFVIPGFIWAIKFFFAPYYAVDKGLNPIEALKASSKATMGMKWDILAFYIVAQIVGLLGFFAFGVGAFVTVPAVMIATASLYRLMDGGSIKAK